MKKIHIILFIIFASFQLFSQREMERLNRGLIAFNKGGSVYLNWRLFALEDYTVGFNVYRSANGGDFTKINSSEITATTDYTDNTANINQDNSYYVVPVINGAEQNPSEICTFKANTPDRQYFPIALESINGKNFSDYNIVHVYPGDVDGDGDYDYIVKRNPVDARYNYIILDCYDNTGAFKWRINLGPNVETYINTMTAPVLVADFNSDGKAEILAKTGEATIFGDGITIGDTNGDGKTDYNTHAGSGTMANIFEGPEFISLIDGETGAEIDRNNFIHRGATIDWGDDYGARVNFIMSSVGYFDGVHPGAVFSRGEGKHMVVEAWNVQNNKLVKIWNYSSIGKRYSVGGWTDFHQIQCIDVDGDGKDEVSWGACMLNSDGSFRYTTELVHGDRFQITDIDPNRPGLEVFAIQQKHPNLIGSALYDAATGSMIKKWYLNATADVGRGDVADLDPNSPGMEMFDTGTPTIHSANGGDLNATAPFPAVSVWWDGDLLRENFVAIGSDFNPAINKWNYNTNQEDRHFTLYNDDGSWVLACPYAGRIALIADVLGDWREELFLETKDRTTLRVYSSYASASARVYTLMQNPAYRTAVTSKGYLCTKYTDFFLGANMATPPTPDITLVGGEPDCAGAIGGSATLDECNRCTGGTTGIYACADLDEGYYTITAKASNLNVSSTNGLTQQIAESLNMTQIWKLEKSGMYYKIFSVSEKSYITYNTPSDGADIGFDGGNNNEFSLEKTPEGNIMIIAEPDSNFVLDVPACEATAGLEINFWSRLNNNCQSFIFETAATKFDCAGVWEGKAYFDACGTCVGGTTEAKPCIAIELEDACSFDGVLETEHVGYSGDGYVNINNEKDASLSLYLYAETERSETIELYYANASSSNRPLQVLLNDTEVYNSIEFTPSEFWTDWHSISLSFEMRQGLNIITLVSLTDEGAANFDKVIVSDNITTGICTSQTIELTKGWNLISIAVEGLAMNIASLFPNASEVKTFESFYSNKIPEQFNTLKTIEIGKAYFVYNTIDEQITIEGIALETAINTDSFKLGWNLTGYPYIESKSIDDVFGDNLQSLETIKNFDSFWIQGGKNNSLETLETGKGYAVLKIK